jgi:HAD superfamily 5'-nucleotidase-like hydrolase
MPSFFFCLLLLLAATPRLSSLRLDFPAHPTNPSIQTLLSNAERTLTNIKDAGSSVAAPRVKPLIKPKHRVYANSYLDMGKIRDVGFDFDYTLVHYSPALLELIYNMAGQELIDNKRYPKDLKNFLKFDSNFSIRGLAVDKETGWICHLSSTHKVSLAYLGKSKVSRSQMADATSGKNAMSPAERAARLRPLNDLFSMSEATLIADVIQYFITNNVAFQPAQVVEDVMGSIGQIHKSLAFHKRVAKHPDKYFEQTPYMKEVLETLRESGKSLFLCSNSPFWFVDAGMRFNFGPSWRSLFSTVITSAGKPKFYTEKKRPFREVLCGDETNPSPDVVCDIDKTKEAVSYERVSRLLPTKVYTEGCLNELIRLVPSLGINTIPKNDLQTESAGGDRGANSKVLYIGDNLFADLVDAKREFGWYTAGVLSELRPEVKKLASVDYLVAKQTIEVLLAALRLSQDYMGEKRSEDDARVLDKLEQLVSAGRDKMNAFLGNERFGSIFSARHQPSLFSASLLRYCDVYMGSVEALVNYSPSHRFYPDFVGTLPHQGAQDGDRNVMERGLVEGIVGTETERSPAKDKRRRRATQEKKREQGGREEEMNLI